MTADLVVDDVTYRRDLFNEWCVVSPDNGELYNAYYEAHCLDEIERLRRWKAEATEVLMRWDALADHVIQRLDFDDVMGRRRPDIVAEAIEVRDAEIERLRAAGDELAEALAWWGKGNDRGDAALAAWKEARRG